MNAVLPGHKTKIVATIGPASESPDMLARLIRAGLDVARLNFSHGSPAKHAEVIQGVRGAARETGRRVAIMISIRKRASAVTHSPLSAYRRRSTTMSVLSRARSDFSARLKKQSACLIVRTPRRVACPEGLVW